MALKSEGFVDIDMSTLESVLGRETLNCKEMHLLEAALNWAGAECARREIELTPQNKRSVLGSALYLVRIPTMTLEEFANGAAQMGILTQQETIDIFFHFTANNKPSLQYPTKARAGLKSQVNMMVVTSMSGSGLDFKQLGYRFNLNSIKIRKFSKVKIQN